MPSRTTRGRDEGVWSGVGQRVAVDLAKQRRIHALNRPLFYCTNRGLHASLLSAEIDILILILK